MHAAGGSVLFYRDLANGLGTDQPVYGLQARGISDRSETAHDRVEEMAAEYLEEICRFQPHGPYRLCGSSFGGLVAVECARQLQARGKEVSLLAVFDTYAPGYLSANLSKPGPLSFVHRSIDRLRNTANQLRDIKTGHGKIEFVVDRIDRLKNRQKRRILWRTNEIAIQYKKATGRELPNDLGRNHKAIQRAELSYLAGSYDGQLVLLRASNQPSNITFDPLLGWGRFIRQGIVAEEVRGIHGAIAVYPSAAELAQKLSRYLDESRTEAHPDSLGSHVEVKAVESLAVGTGSKNL
jgi:thioesterase domain-containing protein